MQKKLGLAILGWTLIGAGCTGPQIAANPKWTPAVRVVTPTLNPDLVPVTPTPINIPTKIYIIKRGENLTQIAQRYGMTTDQLAALNGIQNPNTIQAGQEIKVPASTPHTTPTP